MPSSPKKPGPSSLALWANLGIVYVVWGSTYFGIAISIETIPPFLMAAIRFAIAGAILLAWDLLRHPEARRLPSRRQLLDSFIVGGLLLGIGNGFVVFGEKTVPSGIAAILIGNGTERTTTVTARGHLQRCTGPCPEPSPSGSGAGIRSHGG
jgi:drug/metabolite transporter (DMT)-like permease